MKKTYNPCPHCEGRENNCAGCELRAYRELGSIKELSALMRAKAEGGLAVFPCKEGDEIYVIEPADCKDGSCPDSGTEACKYSRFHAPDEKVLACQNKHRDVQRECVESITADINGEFCINGWLMVRADEVFVTQAEAEAALSGGNNDGR